MNQRNVTKCYDIVFARLVAWLLLTMPSGTHADGSSNCRSHLVSCRGRGRQLFHGATRSAETMLLCLNPNSLVIKGISLCLILGFMAVSMVRELFYI